MASAGGSLIRFGNIKKYGDGYIAILRGRSLPKSRSYPQAVEKMNRPSNPYGTMFYAEVGKFLPYLEEALEKMSILGTYSIDQRPNFHKVLGTKQQPIVQPVRQVNNLLNSLPKRQL